MSTYVHYDGSERWETALVSVKKKEDAGKCKELLLRMDQLFHNILRELYLESISHRNSLYDTKVFSSEFKLLLFTEIYIPTFMVKIHVIVISVQFDV